MFGFLKDKLKDWVGKAKEKIAGAEKEEKKKPEKTKEEKSQKEKKSKIKETKKKETAKKPEKEAKVKEEEIKEERKVTEKIVEDIEKEKQSKEKKSFFAKLKDKFKEKPEEEKETKESEEIKKTPERVEEISEQEIEEQQQIQKIEKRIEQAHEIIKEEKKGFFSKLKSAFVYKISEEDFNSLFEDLEMLLLENNVALEVTEAIKKSLSEKLIGKEIKKDDLEQEIRTELKKTLNEILIDPDNPLDVIKQQKDSGKPFVILFFGINGTGKTTSIAKLANLLKKHNISVALAAADTFRAASIEQLQIHADRLKVPLIKQDYHADPSAVAFDAIKYAEKHKINVVLIDTAGRMHTKTNLIAEMQKICRVTNPDLKIFVAESIAGNDATEQARTFNEAIEIDGSILSKADIDEKGGTIISISHITHKPIFYLGTGQNYEDLQLFDKQKFINNLGL